MIVISGANMESNRNTNVYHVGGTRSRGVSVLLSVVVPATEKPETEPGATSWLELGDFYTTRILSCS